MPLLRTKQDMSSIDVRILEIHYSSVKVAAQITLGRVYRLQPNPLKVSSISMKG